MIRLAAIMLFIFLQILPLSLMGACIASAITGINHYGANEGLSSEKVFSIVEDTDGAIWIGSKNGIDRFNGRKFKHYTLEGDFYYGDFAARSINVALDKSGQILAHDNVGRIYRYNPSYDKFELWIRLNDLIHGDITLNKLLPVNDSTVLIGLNSGVWEEVNGRAQCVIPNVYVNDLAVNNGDIYVTATDGVYKKSGDRLRKAMDGNSVQSLFIDRDSKEILLGTFNNGLWKADYNLTAIEPIKSDGIVINRPIRKFIELDSNKIAIGVDGGGVFTLNRSDKLLSQLMTTDDSTPFHLKGNGVYALLKDHYGNLWTGSYTGGLSMCSFDELPVAHILHERGNRNSLLNNNVNSVAESGDGNIWFANDAGISIQSPHTNTYRHLDLQNVVVTISRTANSNIIAGTYGDGIYLFDERGNKLKHVGKNINDKIPNYIFSITQDSTGNFWVASIDGGVVRLDSDLSYKSSYSVPVAFSITMTPDKKVAAATSNGFYMIDPVSDEVSHYAHTVENQKIDASSYIVSLLFFDKNTVWIATEGGGINVYDIPSRCITDQFNTANGLPSNDIYSMERDKDGRILVGTGNGIAMFDDSIFISLNYINGIAKEYNKSASTLLNNGDMVFGSVNGAVRITPSKIKASDYIAEIHITSFEIEGQSEKEIPPRNMYRDLQAGKIVLSHTENSFEIEYESINLPFQNDIMYQYMLDGYDKDWSSVSPIDKASYKQVIPGKYRFKVRSLRASSGYILDTKEVEIIIKSPWWAQWWAWIVYSIVICGAVYFIIKYKRYQIQKQYDDDKIKFFINTTHDIKTPVSLVLAPITDLQNDDSLSAESKELVSLASANIRKLNAITTQLLEFERFDTNKRAMRLEVIDMGAFLTMEIDCFRDAFNRKGISLSYSGSESDVMMSADRYLLEMMIDNLLSNACKYTNPGGKVKIDLSTTKDKLRIVIADNGIGIPKADRKLIFHNVHRAGNARESNEPGTGFGLLQVRRIVKMLGGTISMKSKEGEGTSFTLIFSKAYGKEPVSIDSKLNTSSLEELVSVSPFSHIDGNNHSQSLLIVEDNGDLRTYLRNLFAKQYNVAAVATADEALEYLGNHFPDLIISDIMMPGMQGDEFCRVVKENVVTAGIPVILLTAKNDVDSTIGGLKCGADDYIAKPFNSDILRLKVKGMIENRERLRKHLLNDAIVSVVYDGGETPVENSSAEQIDNIAEGDREFVNKASGIVADNISDQNFDIDSLCREMAMSRTLFYTKLKSLTGRTPQEFIRLLRLEKAAELLRQGQSVAEAADRTGFGNVKYFSTVFKKHFGVQPSKYNA